MPYAKPICVTFRVPNALKLSVAVHSPSAPMVALLSGLLPVNPGALHLLQHARYMGKLVTSGGN